MLKITEIDCHGIPVLVFKKLLIYLIMALNNGTRVVMLAIQICQSEAIKCFL